MHEQLLIVWDGGWKPNINKGIKYLALPHIGTKIKSVSSMHVCSGVANSN